MTVCAPDRILASADRLVHFCKRGRRGNARTIADAVVARRSGAGDRARLPGHDRGRRATTRLCGRRSRPSTRKPPRASQRRCDAGPHASRCSARAIRSSTAPSCICGGGCSHRFPTEVVPGVTGMSGLLDAAGAPITWGDDVLTVLPGTLPEAELARRLRGTDAAVIMKLGRNLPKVRARAEGGRAAWRVRSMSSAAPWRASASVRSPTRRDDEAPYFSMILVPGRGTARCDGGSLTVVGLGPGRRALAHARRRRRRSRPRPISSATAPISTACRCAPASARHASDNRVELERARARAGARGRGPRRSRSCRAAIPASSPWRRRCSRRSRAATRPGARSRSRSSPASPRCSPPRRARARRSAAISARISLSDNLKPWEVVEARLAAALEADFVIALYNPISAGAALAARRRAALAAARRAPETPVIFARAVGRPDEACRVLRRSARRNGRRGRHGDPGHHRGEHDAARCRGRRRRRPSSTRRAPYGTPMSVDEASSQASASSTSARPLAVGLLAAARPSTTGRPSARAAAILP